ncbi:MAG: DUF2784 family protein [Dehalococcoidia bacterium]|nr:MAG: DUF2784 family protein [Chloroflexota bacterium]
MRRGNKISNRLLFYLLVASHHAFLIITFFSIPFYIINAEWYITFPLFSWTLYLIFSKELTCPATNWENHLRKKIGKPKIKGFIYHYYLKNFVRIKNKF